MAPPVKQVIMVVVSLMVIALIFPLALGLISAAGDTIVIAGIGWNETLGTWTTDPQTLSDLADPSVITLLTVLLPVLAVIGLIMYFIPKAGD